MLNMTWEFKLEPTAEQVSEIEHILDVCRHVWNFALRERKDWLNSRKSPVNACSMRQEFILPADAPFPNYHVQAKRLTAAKTEYPRLKTVNAQVLQQVLRKLEASWESWRLKRSGLPRFKKPYRMRSFVFPQMLKNCIPPSPPEVRGVGGIKLPQLGWVRVRWSRKIPDLFQVKQAQIVRKASGYFVMLSLQADIDIPDTIPHGHPVGIDVGLEYFLSTSDGEQVKRPRFFNNLHRKLKLLQRRLKKKQKGSANWLKLQKKIARVHQRIADTRKDWHFKLAHHLCDGAGMIFVEDLDFRIMAKGMLGKHTLDAGLGQFVNQILPWVCWKRDVFYGKVDARGTSQECPDCGVEVRKDLSTRIHHCHNCGSIKPRDVASGQVICTRGQRGIETACGGDAAGAELAQSSWHLLKQEIFGATQGISLHTRNGLLGEDVKSTYIRVAG
ncbi:RNA-guided endonuclease InsQ/TnpB family protein [Baaleninema simplex]|uniref:RNA-guided endonuclease InsQ/TnpB family protein n=1 Tax=Baaleninema simplex TaxID=2862350 RepID=UPI000380764C|nr:RNA-guided endonuclease TnpB family protein [Baaleninema simplex]